MSEKMPSVSDAARGMSRLTLEAAREITGIVELMHVNIAAGSAPIGTGKSGQTRGLTGLVYDTIRRANKASAATLDLALETLSALLASRLPQPKGDAIISALNGVLGDHLIKTDNPLAIEMIIRRDGQALDLDPESLRVALPRANGRILVMVHGSCMNDRQWLRDGHDHGTALAHDLDLTPVYLHYNSGRHVSENGRQFATRMEQLIEAWPVPVTELSILAHSMGGLVTRSACHYGAETDNQWLTRLRRIVFLGTPHHGAPLERIGNSFQTALGLSPYTAPLARLTWLRSAGVTDLGQGNLLDEDWQGHDRFAPNQDRRKYVPLPHGVDCFAVAATTGARRGDLTDRLAGDGLVPVTSALGWHPDPSKRLAIPKSHQRVSYSNSHWTLLSDLEIYAQLRSFIAGSDESRHL